MPNERKNFDSLSRRYAAALILILAIGGFLRLYNFEEWLHFEVDQSRDARVIQSVIDGGIGNLPLLGPRAGGTFLRLGPGFYDLQYVSALFFGMTPQGIAMGVALLSIASIGALYLFVRRIFSGWVSVGLTAVSAVSVFLVVYGRFAWNPNPLPFFLIIGFYALLRAVGYDSRHPGRWFVVSAASLGFATHLHFLAFVSVPVIVFLFLLIRHPRFSRLAWMGVIAVLVALYAPVVLNDIATGGTNAREFIGAVAGKANKESHTIIEQVYQNAANQAIVTYTMLTGFERTELPRVESVGLVRFDVKCDGGCRERLLSGGLAIILWLGGLFMLLREVWRTSLAVWVPEEAGDESYHRTRSDAVLLTLIWFLVCSAFFLPLSYDFSPRFFLLIAPIPFIFLGFFVELVSGFPGSHVRALVFGGVVFVALVVSNLYFLSVRFDQIDRSRTENVIIPPDRILKEKVRAPLALQWDVVRWMESYQDKNGWPIYFFSEPEYRRSMRYLIESDGVTEIDVQRFYNGPVYAQGNYFVILRSKSDIEDGLSRFRSGFDVIETVPFGTLTGFVLAPKPEAITDTRQIFEESDTQPSSDSAVPERFTWKEWWYLHTQSSDDPLDEEELPVGK